MNKIESYLINLGVTYAELGENTWIINDPDNGLEQVAVAVNEPLVVVRVKVMNVPSRDREEFYLKLLQLNGSDLIHGAYAVVENDVILIDTLNYETMDLEDFQATIDAVSLALTEHYSLLSSYRN
ncbi:MAG: YbjN domain-containing protein [bacterium]